MSEINLNVYGELYKTRGLCARYQKVCIPGRWVAEICGSNCPLTTDKPRQFWPVGGAGSWSREWWRKGPEPTAAGGGGGGSGLVDAVFGLRGLVWGTRLPSLCLFTQERSERPVPSVTRFCDMEEAPTLASHAQVRQRPRCDRRARRTCAAWERRRVPFLEDNPWPKHGRSPQPLNASHA